MPYKDNNDESLMLRLVKRDHQAFSILVTRHSDIFYRVAYKIVMNKEDAEDILQSAFIKIWDKPNLWKSGQGASFKTWFYKIIVNMCIDLKRKNKDVTACDFIENISDEQVSADNQMIITEQQEMIENAMQFLSVKQRVAITLFYEDGIKQKQAAEILGISVKAFESLLSRGKQIIKDQIIRYDELKRRA